MGQALPRGHRPLGQGLGHSGHLEMLAVPRRPAQGPHRASRRNDLQFQARREGSPDDGWNVRKGHGREARWGRQPHSGAAWGAGARGRSVAGSSQTPPRTAPGAPNQTRTCSWEPFAAIRKKGARPLRAGHSLGPCGSADGVSGPGWGLGPSLRCPSPGDHPLGPPLTKKSRWAREPFLHRLSAAAPPSCTLPCTPLSIPLASTSPPPPGSPGVPQSLAGRAARPPASCLPHLVFTAT